MSGKGHSRTCRWGHKTSGSPLRAVKTAHFQPAVAGRPIRQRRQRPATRSQSLAKHQRCPDAGPRVPVGGSSSVVLQSPATASMGALSAPPLPHRLRKQHRDGAARRSSRPTCAPSGRFSSSQSAAARLDLVTAWDVLLDSDPARGVGASFRGRATVCAFAEGRLEPERASAWASLGRSTISNAPAFEEPRTWLPCPERSAWSGVRSCRVVAALEPSEHATGRLCVNVFGPIPRTHSRPSLSSIAAVSLHRFTGPRVRGFQAARAWHERSVGGVNRALRAQRCQCESGSPDQTCGGCFTA